MQDKKIRSVRFDYVPSSSVRELLETLRGTANHAIVICTEEGIRGRLRLRKISSTPLHARSGGLAPRRGSSRERNGSGESRGGRRLGASSYGHDKCPYQTQGSCGNHHEYHQRCGNASCPRKPSPATYQKDQPDNEKPSDSGPHSQHRGMCNRPIWPFVAQPS